jgi:lipoprotein-releasing system ATP-binding protein
VAVVGASGSGKSTLLHLLGGLDEPTQGKCTCSGRTLRAQSEAERGATRNRALGFVYQFHHLLPGIQRRRERGDAAPHPAAAESGGDEGRVGHSRQGGALRIASRTRPASSPAASASAPRSRARLVTTAGLRARRRADGQSRPAHRRSRCSRLMLELNRTLGTSFVIVTHDLELASPANRVMKLVDGKLYPGVGWASPALRIRDLQ